ncbi:zinc finger protein 800b isoform X2 [Pelmatolapia mariae]|uniref:zinc finger protein 800b isoform X2 n=1 Tax=Pelmatolapia mariae TaxID=158779 RepID=UPI002FE578EB
MSFANHPVPFASQPAASHAHGGRWSCKWRLCVCADAAPAEREPIDTDSGGNNRRALSLSSSAPTWISYKHGRSRRLFEMVMFPSLSLGCTGVQPEMEGGQLHSDTQHEQVQPRREDQCSDQLHLQTSASTEALPVKWDQKETPVDVQEKGNSAGQHQGLCVEPGDPPLLQQPLQTSKSGIQQIIECFRSGTSQLKHMLLREVDTIFECKLCRSLFRGLPNLITHKEYYCLSRLPESDGSSGDDRQSVAMKDLLDAIYPRADRPDYVVRLEPIQTTTKAVFQYLTTEEELARFPSHTPSARESPVNWEGESMESVENNQANQTGGPESHNSPGHNQGQRRWEPEEEAKEEQPPPEDEGSNSGVEDVTISCCLCGQDFNSRRSIRRHCRKMHQTKLEELRKFTETRTVPTSLLSMVKGRPRTLSTPTGKSCPVCLKTFATKANVRRHFDEVHRGLRRDTITPSIASRPGQPFSLEVTPPRKSSNASPTRGHSSKSTPVNSKTSSSNQNQAKPQTQLPASTQANSASCRCTLCKRNYSSQLMLKRHMRIVHKIYSMKSNKSSSTATSTAAAATSNSSSTNLSVSNNVRVKEEAVEPSDEEDDEDIDSSPAPSPGDSTGTAKGVSVAHNATKVKEEEAPSSPKMTSLSSSSSSRGGNACSGSMATKMTKLSVGFDFKQLFCKLCKRQFSSRQNLTKHIELHTDGNDIFIKFYRCPLCRYESRRKRDVLRHVTVVHKKSSTYLAKIMPKLESRAVKRLAEVVLNNSNKRTGSSVKEEVNGRHASSSSSPSPPVTRKQECSTTGPTASSASSSSAPPPAPVTRKQQELSSTVLTPSPPVTRKQERQQTHQHRPISPPLTRRSEKHTHQRNNSSSSTNTTTTTTSSSPSNQTPHTRRHDAQSESSTGTSSTEVRVTKNFSLHACDQCGRAFAKKLYLESHKRSHRNATTAAASRRKGVSTRSKSLVW